MKRTLLALPIAALLALAALSDPPGKETPVPATEKSVPPIDAAAPATFETATFALG